MQEFSLKIGKMTCVNCAFGIEKACKKLEGVRDASVSYANSSGVFLVENEKILEKITQKIQNLGFELLHDEQGLQEYKSKELKSLRLKFFLALSFSLVLMGLEMFFKGFAWLEILFVLIVFYCGKDFFIHAFKGLKNKSFDMNTLISLGSLVAFTHSLLVYFGVFEAQGLYFESAAMIIVFVLLGKMLEQNAKFKAEAYQKSLNKLDVKKAILVQNDESLKEISSSFVRAGDKVLLQSGESICVDGTLESEDGEFDLSFLNGEFMPVLKKRGDEILAGSILLSSKSVLIRANKKAMDSTLEQIKDLIFKASSAKMPDRKSTRLNSSHDTRSRMPSSA